MERTGPDLDGINSADAAEPATVGRARRGTGRRLHGAIANKLGRAIVGGDYAPGDRLEGEVAFSESLDVSRTAYREAVQVLVAKGLVESKPKAGTRVLPRSRWNLLDPDVLAWAFSGQPHMNFVRNLFELRSIIEPAAARLAAERRDRTDLKMMRDALAAMRQHTLATDEGRAADRDFHRAILQATRNDAIIVLSASIGAAVSWTTVFKQRGQPLPRNAIPDHARVYDAIAAGDPDAAAEAMRVLVALALDDTANMVG
ncbi:FadR family transcriptional regulator [Sphingomonas sp. AP4-R1]|uniref:FadR/GntR family transcriptional regulator n=1 Tax=Sphingomonas sp. AP4-R1 TaxID=2735134 RepID=UPI001493A708|nr:FadR/GntR family transcriptional regulator [Sphingomonas sp. AP4-R1]QJU57739.1 FadR family transcriptional regulator [Sphingomonas sp. AP4-R1]